MRLKRKNIMVDVSDEALIKAIGKGNFSLGIRKVCKALANYEPHVGRPRKNEPTNKEKLIHTLREAVQNQYGIAPAV